MRRLLLAACICASLSATCVAAQSIAPDVFRALQASQVAQQAGQLSKAEQALKAVTTEADSLERALIERSQGYLAWAQGRTKAAVALLSRALASGHLSAEQISEDRLNVAKLHFSLQEYRAALKYLHQVAQTNDVLEMQIEAWQGLGRLDKALPLAEGYLKSQSSISDKWLQFMVAANAELKRYKDAQQWQKHIMQRNPDRLNAWKQLAALQQMAGQYSHALATLRTAYSKGIEFKRSDLDALIALASASDQPWQAARLLEGMFSSGLISKGAASQERLAQLHWQARDYPKAIQQFTLLAQQTGKGQHWLSVAQLQIQQGRLKEGLQALSAAEKNGANLQQVRSWRDWAQSRLALEQEQGNQVAQY